MCDHLFLYLQIQTMPRSMHLGIIHMAYVGWQLQENKYPNIKHQLHIHKITSQKHKFVGFHEITNNLTCLFDIGCTIFCVIICWAASLNLLNAASVFMWIFCCMARSSCSCRRFMSCISSRAWRKRSWYLHIVSSFCWILAWIQNDINY